jgi:hypothetical protein
VVTPPAVTLTTGMAPEFTHEAVLPPLYELGALSERSKLPELVSVRTNWPLACTVKLPHRLYVLVVAPLLITTFALTPLIGELVVLTSRMAAASQQML